MNFKEDLYLNFHAHHQLPADNEIVIQSKFLQDNLITPKSDKIFFTSGLHPWHANQLTEDEIKDKLRKLIRAKQIIAVGETGLDKLKGPDLGLQERIFKMHVQIAEEFNLPVIVHSVRTHNEILKLKIDLHSNVPWVLHHFNGSKQLATDLIEHGFYLSLSYHIDNNSSRLSQYLEELPIDKIFLETDDFNVDIKELYRVASLKYGISDITLRKQIMKNLKSLLNV